MVPDTVQGLPTHILVVHAVVVLVPLGALGAALYAMVPRWRGHLRWVTLFVLTAGLGSVPVATSAGENLRDDLTQKGQLGGSAAAAVDRHAEWGDKVLWPTLLTWLLYVTLVVLSRRRDSLPRAAAIALSVAIVAGSAAAITLVVLTGHSGSTAVWNPGG